MSKDKLPAKYILWIQYGTQSSEWSLHSRYTENQLPEMYLEIRELNATDNDIKTMTTEEVTLNMEVTLT